MPVLIGNSTAGDYAVTTNTYAASNGEWYYPVVASLNGQADTIKIRINDFNTTTSLKVVVRSSTGVLLASGTLASVVGVGERSVSVTPFAVTSGTTYLFCILANTGSPRPYQNATTNTVKYRNDSTYASTASTLTLPGTDSGVRQYHMWVEGVDDSPTVTDVNGGDPVTYGQAVEWTTSGFDTPPVDGFIGGVVMSDVSATGGTVPVLTDNVVIPMPGTHTLALYNFPFTQMAETEVEVTPEGSSGDPFPYTGVELVGTPSTDPGSIVIGFDPPAKATDWILYTPVDGQVVVDSSGRIESNYAGTFTFYHLSRYEAPGNTELGACYEYQVILGPPTSGGDDGPISKLRVEKVGVRKSVVSRMKVWPLL